jgi:potassium efflux system protein
MKFPGLLLALLISVAGIHARAQTNDIPSAKQLTELKNLITDDVQLEAARRQTLLVQIDQSTEFLRTAAQFEQSVTKMERDLTVAVATIESIRKDLKIELKPFELSPDADLNALEQQLLQAQAKLNSAQQEVDELEADNQKLTAHQTTLPEKLATTTARLNALEKEADLPTSSEERLPWEISAQRWVIATEIHSDEIAIKLYKMEIKNFDSLKALQVARIDLATRHLRMAKNQRTALRTAVDQQRALESEAEVARADQAQRDAATHHPIIQAIAERNTELAALRAGEDGLSARQRITASELQDAKKLTLLTQQREEEIKKRIEAAGLTHAVAQLLSRERNNLPDLSRYKPRIRVRKQAIVTAQLALLDFSDQREELRDIASNVKLKAAAINAAEAEAQITPLLTEYLTTQRNQLDTLITEYNDYFNLLVDLDTAERKLIVSVNLLTDEISEHILWVRSDPPFSLKTPGNLKRGFIFLIEEANWNQLAQTLRSDLGLHPLKLVILFLLELGLIGASIVAGRRMKKIAALVSKIRTDRFSYTIEVLCYTMLRALPLPLPLFYLAWVIGSFDMHLFSAAVGKACFLTGILTLCCNLVYQAISPYGLSAVHFEADGTLLKWARYRLMRLMASALPLLWLTTLLHQTPEGIAIKPLERFCYIGLQLSIAWFAYRIFSRRSKIMLYLKENNPEKMLVRLRLPALLAVVGIPVVIIIAALVGYYYTSLQMAGWFAKTLGLIFIISLIESLLIRGIQVVSRRAEFQRRIRERQELQQQREAADDGEAESVPESPVESSEMNYITLSENTRKLMNIIVGFALLFGMWFIWADAVPALSVLDRIELWHVTSEGSTAEAITTLAISLTDVINAILVVILTAALTRHLPSLIELAILRQLRMSYGERYAISTIIRYVTIAIGVGITFSLLGLGWSKFKWMAAALSVGLGFGLQEIFANFISGLILLFERPIRVRDYVTVNGTSGEITRIQIRATTITDWDNKELLIPNKQFVTGELVNWTLTSSILRVVIPVGIAYGSDTKKAQEILLGVANSYRLTIPDPEPSAFFTGFGDSALNFELRIFIAHAEQFRLAKHELNMAVDAAFRKAGIVIAFPQLDLHVKPATPSPAPEAG